jgi:hypothetical protein
MAVKPNLFIVGAPKCGTTAWYEYLRHHPDIFFPDLKEPHHFLTDFPGYPQVKSRSEYLDLFSPGVSRTIVGEASPRYLYSQEAAENIAKFNPHAKILIFVRDHVEYLESLFNQHLYGGIETIRDFREAWNLSGTRKLSDLQPPFKEPGLLDYRSAAEFFPQIRRFYDQFPADQVRVFDFADWTRNPRQTYVEILGFLGLEDDGRMAFGRVNEAQHHRFDLLLRFVRNPPAPVAKIVKWLRRLRGRPGTGLGSLLLRISSRRGVAAEIDPEMRIELAEYYKQDKELLKTFAFQSEQIGARQ